MLYRVTHDGLIIGKNSDKTWSTTGGNGNPFPVFLPGEPHEQYEKAVKMYTDQSSNHNSGKMPFRKERSEVAQSRPTLCDPMDCSPTGSSVHGIFQA